VIGVQLTASDGGAYSDVLYIALSPRSLEMTRFGHLNFRHKKTAMLSGAENR